MTRGQQLLLKFIDGFISQNNGVCPSYSEMCTYMNLKSKSGIHRLILGLEERGKLRRLPNRARALEVIKEPETGCCRTCGRPL